MKRIGVLRWARDGGRNTESRHGEGIIELGKVWFRYGWMALFGDLNLYILADRELTGENVAPTWQFVSNQFANIYYFRFLSVK